jgi:Tfp pilus assembly protein PilN
MIRINLLPKEERTTTRKIALPKAAHLMPVAAIAAVVLIVGITAILEHAKAASLRKDVAQLQEEVRAIQPQVDRVKRLTAQREELHRRLDVIRQLDQGRFLSVRVMDNVSREIPQYLWMTNLEQHGGSRVIFSGVTFSNLIVAELMKRLEASPMFANVNLSRTQRGQIDERDVMQFDLDADVTPHEKPSDLSADAFLEELLEEER